MDLKKSAKQIAERGRFGDNVLVHMNIAEVRGLASLLGKDDLTINPETGAYEAFFFLPFLAGLGAAAAPAAAAAIPAAATVAGTGLAAGLGAAALPAAATTAAATALPAAATGAAGLAGTGAAAGLGAGMGTGAITGAGALGAGSLSTPLTAGIAGAGGATGAAGGALSTLPVIGTPASLGGVPLASAGGAGGAAGGAGGGIATGSTAAPIATAGAGGVAGQGSLLTPLATGAAAAPATTSGGIMGGLKGLFGGMDMGKMLQYGALASMMMPQGKGGGDDDDDDGKGEKGKSYDRGEQVAPDDGGSSGGLQKEWNYFPNAHYYAGGGLVKGYAEGGLASLDQPKGKGVQDDKLIDATVAAIQGQVQDPTPILQAFVQTFGQEALRDLIAKVSGTVGQGAAPVQQGDGMSDSIPATVGGQEPAALSEGEYVVPADVVSGLGNGSTDAGANQLQSMVDKTRQMKNGGKVQPPAIDPRSVMPV